MMGAAADESYRKKRQVVSPSRIASTTFTPTGPASTVADWGWTIAGGRPAFVVRFLRGRKMRTEQQLFDELAAALQFPYYFGENWDALNECVADLSWLPAEGYLLVITDGAQILADSSETEWEIFVRQMNDAGHEWSEPSGEGEGWARPATPFHVVLQADGGDFESLSERVARAGVIRDRVQVSGGAPTAAGREPEDV
jgi:hypothetical protein